MTAAHPSDVPNRMGATPLELLPPGAQALVDAAKRLLMEGGMDALRIEKIAAAAGQNRAMIRYYFGNKAALVGRVVDELMHEQVVDLRAQAESLPEGEARISAHVDTSLEFTVSPDFAAFFHVLPAAMRDDNLRDRIADLYIWYRQQNRECLDPRPTAGSQEKVATLATIFLATMDGLLVQEILAPGLVAHAAVGSMLKAIITFVLEYYPDDVQATPEVSQMAATKTVTR